MGVLRDKHNQIKLMIWKGFGREWGDDHTNLVNCNANDNPMGVNRIFKCSEIYGIQDENIAPVISKEQFDSYPTIDGVTPPEIEDVVNGLPKISSLGVTEIPGRNIAAGKNITGVAEIPTITVMYDSRAYQERRNLKGVLPQFLMDLRVYSQDYPMALDVAEHLKLVMEANAKTGFVKSPEEEFSVIAYLPGQLDTKTVYSFLLRIIV